MLGNCRTPHFLGEPTPDRKALTQLPHEELPQGLCRDWRPIVVCSGCGVVEGDNHAYDCPEAQD